MTRSRATLLTLAIVSAFIGIAATRTSYPSIVATACTNQFVRSIAAATGAGTCATVSLTADVTGTLPLGNGGTGSASGPVVGAAIASFSAHKNGTDQTGVASNTDTLVTFGTALYNVGNYYNTGTSLWTPPAGKIFCTVTVDYTSGILAGFTALAIRKNGTPYKKLVTTSIASLFGASVIMDDTANGTDTYSVSSYAPAASTYTIGGASTDTYFMCHATQ